MELVNYSDDESDVDEGTEPSESVQVGVKSKWVTQDDSESEEEDASRPFDAPSSSESKAVSVLDLLSASEKPSFLSKPVGQQKFQVRASVINDYNTVKPKYVLPTQPTPQELAKANLVTRDQFDEIKRSKEISESMQQSEEDRAMEARIATTASKEGKQHETAKDRVKRQRLAGQSGIGEDFKAWKSEEEMKQRQQFD